MRRLGGLVAAVVLSAAACAAGEPAAVERSTAPGDPGETATLHVADTPPETVLDLGVELAEGVAVDPVPDQELAPSPPEPVRSDNPIPHAAALDPVPANARPVARAASASPVGPTATGHIEIPALGLSHPTYEGISLAVIDHGPSHWPGTAQPGHPGNTVFPGHRTTHSRPFHDLDKLSPGDSVIFTTKEGRFTYRVTRTFVVDDEDTWIIEPTSDATFTIFACHPKGSARQRIVATGELVSAPAGPPPTAAPITTRPTTTTTTRPKGLLDVLFGG